MSLYEVGKKDAVANLQPDYAMLEEPEYIRGYTDGSSLAIEAKKAIPEEKDEAVLDMIKRVSSGIYDNYLKQAKDGGYQNLEIPVSEFELFIKLVKGVPIYASVEIN